MASQARPSGGAKVEASNVSARMRKDWFVCVAMVTHALRGAARMGDHRSATLLLCDSPNESTLLNFVYGGIAIQWPPDQQWSASSATVGASRAHKKSVPPLSRVQLYDDEILQVFPKISREKGREKSRCHRFPEYDDEILQVEGPFFSSPTQKQVLSVPPEGRQNDRSFVRPSDKKSAQTKDRASRKVENASSGSATMTFRTFWLGKDPKSFPPAGHSRVRR